MDQPTDRSLLQRVQQRLMRTGLGSQSRITATVSRGDVTVTGLLQYAVQRQSVLRAIGAVAGVRRVIDQLQLAPQVKKWG